MLDFLSKIFNGVLTKDGIRHCGLSVNYRINLKIINIILCRFSIRNIIVHVLLAKFQDFRFQPHNKLPHIIIRIQVFVSFPTTVALNIAIFNYQSQNTKKVGIATDLQITTESQRKENNNKKIWRETMLYAFIQFPSKLSLAFARYIRRKSEIEVAVYNILRLL